MVQFVEVHASRWRHVDEMQKLLMRRFTLRVRQRLEAMWCWWFVTFGGGENHRWIVMHVLIFSFYSK